MNGWVSHGVPGAAGILACSIHLMKWGQFNVRENHGEEKIRPYILHALVPDIQR